MDGDNMDQIFLSKEKNSMQQNWIRDRSEYETHEQGHY